MGAFKPWHWIVILVLLILLFGANKLPNMNIDIQKIRIHFDK